MLRKDRFGYMDKIVNDSASYIKSLTARHGRSQEWAEQAVREAASLPAKDALKQNVIDIVASDMVDLLKRVVGQIWHMKVRY